MSEDMKDPVVVAELRKAAEDSLARGFAILTCEPHAKEPWPKYSPNAWKSATRNPDLALKAYNEGWEANYAVACGASNLTVVDCDKGFNCKEDFLKWKKTHNVPDTFTIHTGRAEGYGVHMYFSGAVPTMVLDMGDVVGELRGIGAYVIGPGSIHPSGNRYEIIDVSDVVPLPEGLVEFAKLHQKTKDFEHKSSGEPEELIKAGNRWIHLQSMAGKFRNMGLSQNLIYEALKDWCTTHCEDGANYPDEKIQALALAASTVFDVMEESPVVFFGDSKKIDVTTQEIDTEAIDGDWIGDLTHNLSDGTFIPPCFVRSQIKTVLGTSLDGLVGFPGQPDLHMKHWNMLISQSPESGKGESWKRVGEMALAIYLKKTDVGLPPSGWFSSGEYLVHQLAENFEGKNTLTYIDEGKHLFEKGSGQNSTLFSKMLSMYDRSDASAGSLSNDSAEFSDISLSWTACFTRSSFDNCITGKGAGGDGFLSRCVLNYCGEIKHIGDWKDLNTKEVNANSNKMFKRWQQIFNLVGEKRAEQLKQWEAEKAKDPETPRPPKWRFIIPETEEAHKLRGEFQKWLAEKRKQYADDQTLDLCSRLEAHFKRDLLLRALFSGLHPEQVSLDDLKITAEMVQRSITWAQYELYLREELWPVDLGDKAERMEQAMRRALRKHHALTKSQLQTACNVARAGSGGAVTFNQAWASLIKAEILVEVGKTHKGTVKYGLND
jgi:hypothetical protein